MSNTETIVKGHNFGDTLVPFENMWVALSRHDGTVLESAETLPELLAKLRDKELTEEPVFMQVLPHHVSFISRVHEVPVLENRTNGR